MIKSDGFEDFIYNNSIKYLICCFHLLFIFFLTGDNGSLVSM